MKKYVLSIFILILCLVAGDVLSQNGDKKLCVRRDGYGHIVSQREVVDSIANGDLKLFRVDSPEIFSYMTTDFMIHNKKENWGNSRLPTGDELLGILEAGHIGYADWKAGDDVLPGYVNRWGELERERRAPLPGEIVIFSYGKIWYSLATGCPVSDFRGYGLYVPNVRGGPFTHFEVLDLFFSTCIYKKAGETYEFSSGKIAIFEKATSSIADEIIEAIGKIAKKDGWDKLVDIESITRKDVFWILENSEEERIEGVDYLVFDPAEISETLKSYPKRAYLNLFDISVVLSKDPEK